MERIARAGLIGMHTVSSRPQVALPGGARPSMGTNPIAFGFPTQGEPLVTDMGTSALMFTDLALRVRRGEALPQGVAVDAQGRPTRDPLKASQDAALPFGGYKGFVLGLAAQALGVLAGSGLGRYRQDLSESLARVKATPRQPGVDAIRIPSERSFAQRAINLREGIEIDAEIHDALARWAGRGRASPVAR